MKNIYFLLIALSLSTLGYAQIAAYSGTSTPTANAVANISATPLSRNAGIDNADNGDGTFRSSGWSTNNSIDTNDYIQWSITANTGYTIAVTNITINFDRDTAGGFGTSQGARSIVIRSSVDNYTSNLYSNTNVGTNPTTVTFPAAQSSTPGGTITYRLYGYNSTTRFFGLFNDGTLDIEGALGTVLSVTNTGIRINGSVIPPPCPLVTGLSVNTVTASSANITWAAGGGSAWEVAVQTAGTGTPIGAGTPVATNSFAASLNQNTAYEVYVRRNCTSTGDGFSPWTGPVNFTTPIQVPVGVTCAPGGTTAFVFTEEFNTQGGWTGNITQSDQSGFWEIPGASGSVSTGPDSAFSGANYMNYEASFSGTTGSTATASAVSPAINLTAAIAAELSFYLHAYGAAMGTLNVGVSNSASGPFTTLFTQSGQLQTSGSAPWVAVGINLDAYAGQTIYIEFENTGAGGIPDTFTGDMSIDFLRVETCNAPVLCPDPTNIVVSNITGTSADVTWDAGGSETDWEIAIQPDGTGTPAGAGTPTSTNNPYTDNTLTQLTAYEVYVRADCDTDGFSNWVGPVDFTTPLANDDFADAIPISCGNSYNGDTTTATIDEVGAPDVTTVEPDTGADNDSPNVWYSFVGTGDLVTLSTCSNTNFDTEILVFTGTSGNLTLIDDAFDECDPTGLSNFEAETTFTSVFGTQYFIAVEGWNVGDVGAFQLSVICTPPVPVTYTYTNGWDANGNPDGVSTVNDDIIIASGEAVFSAANTNSQSITVNPTGAITVDVGATLFSLNGMTLQSNNTEYSSVIANGTISGTVNYERHVNGYTSVGVGAGANDLISSPVVSSENFGAFAASNDSNLFEDPDDSNVKLFGPFNKMSGSYDTYDITVDGGAAIEPGVGYRAASTDNSGFTFTGTINQGVVPVDIVFSGPSFRQWNLVGNPYPAYINVGTFLNHEVAPGVRNVDIMVSTGAAIYGYDGNAGNGWTIWNLNTPTRNMTPGQGFFVQADAADVAAYDLEFSPDMMVIGNSDDFIMGRTTNSNNAHLKLQAEIGGVSRFTDFYFNDNSTSGLDAGYDAAMFGNASSTDIYSQLVQDNVGVDMAIQSLAYSSLGTDIVVPLGINVSQGQQVIVSIEESTLPDNVLVYLEDNLTNTFTLLNTSDYIFTANTTISDTGRFFLRFSEDTLSNPEQDLNALQVYTTKSPSDLIINGQLFGKTMLALYDIQGRLVLETTLNEGETSQRIDVSHLNAGIYVANLSNNTQQKTQKVIIR